MRRQVGSVVIGLAAFASLTHPVVAQAVELVDRSVLRVCADPNNLPYSNQAGEGFENKIAEMLADDLGVPLEYTWYPNTIGFARNTLNARVCDVVIGVAKGTDFMATTEPYYSSSYVMLARSDRPEVDSLDDPALEDLKIGIIARTPPVNMLVRRGLLDNIESYDLMVDTRHYAPTRDLVADLVAEEIDVALAWGPLAGYWASQQEQPIRLVPLTADPGSKVGLQYDIAMGLRRREPSWAERLNTFLAEHDQEIVALLEDYGVPLLEIQGGGEEEDDDD